MQDVIIPGSIVFSNEAATEPVTLEYLKGYLRVGYSTDDAILIDMITAARQWVESYTGVSVITRKVACTVELYNSIELPYGPVTDTPTITGGAPEDVTFTAGQFPRITGGCGTYQVNYQAGYAVLPMGLKLAICARVAATYENRGDKDAAVYAQIAKEHCLQFKRIVQWL
jgi:hypothetical protein